MANLSRRARRAALHPEVVEALASPRLRIHIEAHGAYHRACAASGMRTEDIVQEVALGVITRHLGCSRWDASRGRAAYSYVAMVASCVVTDLARRRCQPSPGGEAVGLDEDDDGAAAWDALDGQRMAQPRGKKGRINRG